MQASDPAEAARELIFGRVKLCGLNSGAALSAARPAAFAGFMFVTVSPRRVTLDEAVPLAAVVRTSGIMPVGIFRDAPISDAADHARILGLRAVQLHGREDQDYVTDLRRKLPQSCEIWTALSVGREPLAERGGDRLLFDNGHGGSGRSFDWSLVKGHPDLGRSVVAGGIRPDNARAAQRLGAYAIDVGSALDASPGVKSPDKIAALFEALRPAARERLLACA
jgi:indole-3-glycerol phosphate synthase/phosphoribosylanthranilate isomerase